MRPKLNSPDSLLYAAYCRALRESETQTIPKMILIEELKECEIEEDIGFYILSQLNSYHNILRKEKQDRLKKPS